MEAHADVMGTEGKAGGNEREVEIDQAESIESSHLTSRVRWGKGIKLIHVVWEAVGGDTLR